MTFLSKKSENGKLCFDCTGVSGLHVGPSGEAPFSVSFTTSVGGLCRNRVFVRLWQDLGLPLGGFWIRVGTIFVFSCCAACGTL